MIYARFKYQAISAYIRLTNDDPSYKQGIEKGGEINIVVSRSTVFLAGRRRASGAIGTYVSGC